MPEPRRFDPDLEWLDLLEPKFGLVVAPSLLKELGLTPQLQTRADNAAVAELLRPEDEKGPALSNTWEFCERILGWPKARVVGAPGGPALPEDLCKVLPESDTVLEPHWAVAGVDGGWQLLVRIEAPGIKPDARGALAGWEATPHQRFERLLRETQIASGVLITDNELRLVYAPSRETSGWIAFPLRPLATVAGRPMLGGLKLMLDRVRLFTDAEDRRLPTVLKASRDAQTTVSTTLAEQVVGALHELLRGLTTAEPKLIGALASEQPQHLYEGLLTVLMRLVFILYAEDRDLIPSRTDEKARALYEQGYSVRGLHAKLLDDQARYPDTMEERRGAWGRLIVLFHLIHAGDRTGWIHARGGKLFNPDTFLFLEGRANVEEPARIVSVTDGCLLRVLDGLLTLKGERLSYRTLDVEQIGSVYETVMGFTVLTSSGPVLAIRAGKHNRTPVFVDLAELAALRPEERLKRLKEAAQRSSLTERQQREIRAAAGVEGMAAALDGIVDERGSPDKRILPDGAPILQPTAERRSTGSHYTPRSLTEPIVGHALEPVFERLGPNARPEDVLDLKICDPAMGSGAFLVEACRALAARLVQAWARWPETRPKLPPDEDDDLHARRLVAQRCLYGVDKNPMATDLAKLSLWLATLARDHEFTFLDHALKPGDSLVGLTRTQIAALHWDTSKPDLPLLRPLIQNRFEAALAGRTEIREAPDDVERSIQEARYQQIENRLSDARRLGDAVVAAFLSADRARAREAKRQEIESWLNELPEAMWAKVGGLAGTLRKGGRPVPPFHWELEFPEAFEGDNPGFDVVIGNPPYLGVTGLENTTRAGYTDWLRSQFPGSGGKCDLITFFFRRAYELVGVNGATGLLATNTIAQGDTRESGLLRIVRSGGAIIRAQRRIKWPGEDASVVATAIHIMRGDYPGRIFLDAVPVEFISSYLSSRIGDVSPETLYADSISCSKGVVPYGAQFFLPANEDALKGSSPVGVTEPQWNEFVQGNSRPAAGGNELNELLDLFEWRRLIDLNRFGSEEELMQSDAYDIARRILFEPRQRLGEVSGAKRLRRFWWQYQFSPSMALNRIDRIGIARLSTHFAWRLVPAEIIPTEQIVCVAPGTKAVFAGLQSRTHEVWTWFFGSSMKDDLRYTPSRCFETFPFRDGLETDPVLEAVGQDYDGHRTAMMAARSEGMTEIYNRFHERRENAADVVRLRELHAEMDRAVLRAYGWDDLAERAEPLFLDETNEDDHKYQGRFFWPAEFRD
jgi:hypothetical protein